MRRSIPLMLSCLLSVFSLGADPAIPVQPVGIPWTNADYSRALLSKAFDRAFDELLQLDDPRDASRGLMSAWFRFDPDTASRHIMELAEKTKSLQLSHKWDNFYGMLAARVAPFSETLRDELLVDAIEEADAALNDDKLWILTPKTFGGGIPYMDPQRYIDEQRLLLSLEREIFRAVIEKDESQRSKAFDTIIASAIPMGSFGSCTPRPYWVHAFNVFSGLDAPLAVKSLKISSEREVLDYAVFASTRFSSEGDNPFTRALVLHRIEVGIVHIGDLQALCSFDPERALSLVTKLPESQVDYSVPKLLITWAWHDSDAALAYAEAISNSDQREIACKEVARVCVYRKPELVERALQNVVNKQGKEFIRKNAAREQSSRASGKRPLDTPSKAERAGRATPSELRAEGRKFGNPEEEQILTNPSDTSWLVDTNRTMYLSQAANTARRDGKPEVIDQIISGLNDPSEIYSVLRTSAIGAAGDGDMVLAVKLLGRLDGIHCVAATTGVVDEYLRGESLDR